MSNFHYFLSTFFCYIYRHSFTDHFSLHFCMSIQFSLKSVWLELNNGIMSMNCIYNSNNESIFEEKIKFSSSVGCFLMSTHNCKQNATYCWHIYFRRHLSKTKPMSSISSSQLIISQLHMEHFYKTTFNTVFSRGSL